MHVAVNTFGTFLGKKSERLIVREKGQVVSEIPFHDIEQITIMSGGVSFSTDVIRECVLRGIFVNFLSGSGEPYAKIISPNMTGTVVTRREQLLGYLDERAVILARAFVEGKIRNQANVLRYFAKHRRTASPDLYQTLTTAAEAMERCRSEALAIPDTSRIDDVRERLMSAEGRAAQSYWSAVGRLLEGHASFPGREHRGTNDPVNAALNYGYSMLFHQVSNALLIAGLEPFGGFLHADRSGKPSLALDLVEEFRAPVVDRPILAALTKGFTLDMEDGRLTDESRKEVMRRVAARFEDANRHEGKRHRLKMIILMQARRIATFLRRESNYRPFVADW